jgi:hypothetical protein
MTDEHDDVCRCDGCVNTNYPRSRDAILAEMTEAAREHGCLWVLDFVMPKAEKVKWRKPRGPGRPRESRTKPPSKQVGMFE